MPYYQAGQRVRPAAEVQDDAFSTVDGRSGFVIVEAYSNQQALRLVLAVVLPSPWQATPDDVLGTRSGGLRLVDRFLPATQLLLTPASPGCSVDMAAPVLAVFGRKLALLRWLRVQYERTSRGSTTRRGAAPRLRLGTVHQPNALVPKRRRGTARPECPQQLRPAAR
jgi:hypothetical protein